LLRGRKGSINAHCSSVRLLGYLAPSILPKIGKMSGFHTGSKTGRVAESVDAGDLKSKEVIVE